MQPSVYTHMKTFQWWGGRTAIPPCTYDRYWVLFATFQHHNRGKRAVLLDTTCTLIEKEKGQVLTLCSLQISINWIRKRTGVNPLKPTDIYNPNGQHSCYRPTGARFHSMCSEGIHVSHITCRSRAIALEQRHPNAQWLMLLTRRLSTGCTYMTCTMHGAIY